MASQLSYGVMFLVAYGCNCGEHPLFQAHTYSSNKKIINLVVDHTLRVRNRAQVVLTLSPDVLHLALKKEGGRSGGGSKTPKSWLQRGEMPLREHVLVPGGARRSLALRDLNILNVSTVVGNKSAVIDNHALCSAGDNARIRVEARVGGDGTSSGSSDAAVRDGELVLRHWQSSCPHTCSEPSPRRGNSFAGRSEREEKMGEAVTQGTARVTTAESPLRANPLLRARASCAGRL